MLRLRLPDTAGQLLERTSVRDGRLIGQTFTPIRKDTRRDPVRLRDTVIDLVPDGIGVRVGPGLQPRMAQTVIDGYQRSLCFRRIAQR